MVSPWDFHPQEIAVTVHLWHGEDDREIPIAMSRDLAAALPKSQAYIYPGEGHLSVMANHVQEILDVLAAPAPSSV